MLAFCEYAPERAKIIRNIASLFSARDQQTITMIYAYPRVTAYASHWSMIAIYVLYSRFWNQIGAAIFLMLAGPHMGLL